MSKITSRLEGKLNRDRFYQDGQQQPSILKTKRPTETELHRIHRAMWSLYLYYEVFHLPFLLKKGDAPLPRSTIEQRTPLRHMKPAVWETEDMERLQLGFLSCMTDWELVELGCIWYRFHQNLSLYWDYSCPHCHDDLLPDELHQHLEHVCIQGSHYGPCTFETALTWSRVSRSMGLREFLIVNDLPAWPKSAASIPNAGFDILKGYQEMILSARNSPGIPRGSLRVFLTWGYCMWDRKRLEAWRLIDSEDGKVPTELEWWKEPWKRPTTWVSSVPKYKAYHFKTKTIYA